MHVDVGAGDGRVCAYVVRQFPKVARSFALEIDPSLVKQMEQTHVSRPRDVGSGKVVVLPPSDFRKGRLRSLIEKEKITHVSCYFVEEGLNDLWDEVVGFRGLR